MKSYYITTFGSIDRPQMTCEYSYHQWLDMIQALKESGRDFEAFTAEHEVCEDYDDWSY